MEIIDRYSRSDAIEDGMLVDITATTEAKEAGFKIPVCLTASVYEVVKVPEGLEGIQDFTGRLWDVCFMACAAVRQKRTQGATQEGMELIEFKVSFLMIEEMQQVREVQQTKTLWLCFHPNEGFTIMLPEDY